MSLTKSKSKANPKISAKHHKKTKPYLKTYWPYIPILLIIVIGLIINGLIKNVPTSQPFRLDNLSIGEVLESSIGLIALCVFLLRHAFAWHKVLVKGEDFATSHPVIDIVLALLIMSCLILVHVNILTI